MIIIVFSFNIALALFCLSVAWKLHQMKRTLRRMNDWLTVAEQKTDCVLYRAPEYILSGRKGVRYSRDQMTRLEHLQGQINRLSTVWGVLQWFRLRQVQSSGVKTGLHSTLKTKRFY